MESCALGPLTAQRLPCGDREAPTHDSRVRLAEEEEAKREQPGLERVLFDVRPLHTPIVTRIASKALTNPGSCRLKNDAGLAAHKGLVFDTLVRAKRKLQGIFLPIVAGIVAKRD